MLVNCSKLIQRINIHVDSLLHSRNPDLQSHPDSDLEAGVVDVALAQDLRVVQMHRKDFLGLGQQEA